MINTLLIPELRDFLENEEYDVLRDFCSSLDACTVAEFLGGLSTGELLKALSILEPHLRAKISDHLDQDIRVGLAVSSRKPEIEQAYKPLDGLKSNRNSRVNV